MEYEKHIKRLVLGFLRKECKNAYKVFLKYNFHSQHKHIPTRVAGQTLEDILRIYSRIEEIVQGRLEDTNYYKERSVEFSSPIYLDDQLLYLLEKYKPFTPASTPCPRSPADSSVVESHHEHDTTHRSDVETTPEHTLPGNISSHDSNYHSRTPYRKDAKSPAYTTPYKEKYSISNMEVEGSGKTEYQKKLANNVNPSLDTPDIPCYSHRDDNEKNKGIGTELEDMFQDFLGTPVVNATTKSVTAQSTTSASSLSFSSNVTHRTTTSKNWQQLDEHNNRAVSSILAATTPSTKPTGLLTTATDNLIYNDNINTYPEHPTQQIPNTATSLPSNQYLLPTSSAMYIVPQPTMCTSQSNNQQQQFYIVNQPVVIPQPPPVVQFLQPIQPAASKPVVINPNRRTPSAKENDTHLSEQDIMSMPTIIINERNEVTHADPACFTNVSEARNIKEFINLYRPSDQSPLVKVQSKKKGKSKPLIKPTPTIKVEIYQRDTALPVDSLNAAVNSPPPSVSKQICTGTTGGAGLPNLNDTITGDSNPMTREETSDSINKDDSNVKTNSLDQAESRMADSVCTPSPLMTTVRKPTPKSGSHVRTLTFPSPTRKTAEKSEPTRSSPRIVSKQQATKDLFCEENKKPNAKAQKAKQIAKRNKSEEKDAKKTSSKSPGNVSEKEKPKSTKKITKATTATTEPNEEFVSKNSWDANLRKLIPPVENKTSTPTRKASTKRKARRSADCDITEADGKKLEEALKTPEIEKAKRRTPGRKKTLKTSNSNQKLEENSEPQDEETKGETKVLSPSKLNANKRNILAAEVEDITPSIAKESSQYPISSKIRRNIASLLETPIKEGAVPPTPGKIPGISETPFTPMLRANLKDFTDGDNFSINTPNFPVTPGLASMVNSAAYYMLNDNESNKVTEATVLQEEKKSSVRKSDDDDDIDISPKVYGTKEILDNFNKSRVGKKNLELLDSEGVKWDGSSDSEEKSGEMSENNSEGESNNTVIQKQGMRQPEEIEVSPRSRKSSGKCMADLHSQHLKGTNDHSESFDHTLEVSDQEDDHTNPHNGVEDKGGGQCAIDEVKTDKNAKSPTSDSDSEVISKKVHDENKNRQKKLWSSGSDSLQDGFDQRGKDCNEQVMPVIEESNEENIVGVKCANTTQEIRQTISEVCLENTLETRPSSTTLKAELEQKKRRLIESEKAQQSAGNNKRQPSKRTTLKSQANLKTPRSKRKSTNPKRVAESRLKKEASEESKNQNVTKSEGNTECRTVDSQDEFFKKSGTNLHRKNKGCGHALQRDDDSGKGPGDTVDKERRYSSSEDKKCSNEHGNNDEENQNQQSESIIEKNNDQNISCTGQEDVQNTFTEPDSPDEFEKTWDDCHFTEIDSEHLVFHHKESKTPNKKLEDYDFGILKKKVLLGVPCSDGSTANIMLAVSPFEFLMEIKPTDESEAATDGSRDEADSSSEATGRKPNVGDSENADCRTDDAEELKCPRKRKHRSDSCNSDSSAKRLKESEIIDTKTMLNKKTIQKVLWKLHGPGPNDSQFR